MQDKNMMGNSLLQADCLERGRLTTDNLAAIHRLVEDHHRRVHRLRWVNIGAWFVVVMVFSSLLVIQNSQWPWFNSVLSLSKFGFVLMTGLLYAALVSWHLLKLAVKNPPSEGGMRMTDIEVRLDRIEALLERAVSGGNVAAPLQKCNSETQA